MVSIYHRGRKDTVIFLIINCVNGLIAPFQGFFFKTHKSEIVRQKIKARQMTGLQVETKDF